MTDENRRQVIPQGYRTGLITAISVLLGFSLTFFRFWNFEASGEWTLGSVVAAAAMVIAVALQLFALRRSLMLEDDHEDQYRKTVRWFVASTAVMLGALLVAVVAVATAPRQGGPSAALTPGIPALALEASAGAP
ncbi:MAG TPA: hypothetical protein VMN79_12945 [Casimicrobiaceae bacterium]|nr:hypothetical protein [Casimicrobiaceae bacterium]